MAYTTSLDGITDVLTAVKNVTEDPCLLEVAKRTSRLADILHAGQQPGVPSGPPVKGIGLCSAVKPLKAATFIAERPWIVPVGIAALFGTLVFIGYQMGRTR